MFGLKKTTPNSNVPQSRSRRRWLRVVIIVGILLVVTSGGLAVWSAVQHGAQSTAKKFLDYVISNDESDSYKLTSKTFGFAVSEQDWTQDVSNYSQVFISRSDTHVGSQAQTDSTGQPQTVESYSVDSSNTNYKVDIYLSKQKTGWLVDKMVVSGTPK